MVRMEADEYIEKFMSYMDKQGIDKKDQYFIFRIGLDNVWEEIQGDSEEDTDEEDDFDALGDEEEQENPRNKEKKPHKPAPKKGPSSKKQRDVDEGNF